MFAIAPIIFLIPYGIVLVIAFFLAVVNIFNLLKYGAKNFVGFLATTLFIAGAATLMYLTWQQVALIDWQTPVQIFGVS